MQRKRSKRHPSLLVTGCRRKWLQCKKTNGESGATFMEVLVTIAIIMILMTTIGLAVAPFIFRGQDVAARTNIKTIETALTAYYAQNFDYPEDSDWKSAVQPYIQGGKIPQDPWKNDYVYVKPGPDGSEYGISSAGKDGIPGNEDDINSWEM
ncbi:MAG: type II secretion system protein GspG [Spirochaetales bacterium]|nr:type II secretion system protein GspG [Spirochaetales bacterium]